MSYDGFTIQMKEVFWGNIILILCCLCYLGWWLIAFYPGGRSGNIGSGVFLFMAVIAGALSLYLILRGINTAPYKEELIPTKYLLWGGMTAYVLLFALTSVLMKRRVTTELLLILGWAVLEFSVLNMLYGVGKFTITPVIILASIIIIAVVVSLLCYVLYYKLEGTASYIDGMIPLLTEAVSMLLMTIIMLTTP